MVCGLTRLSNMQLRIGSFSKNIITKILLVSSNSQLLVISSIIIVITIYLLYLENFDLWLGATVIYST